MVAVETHREELRIALQTANPGGMDKVVYFDAVELLSAFMVNGWPNQARFTSTIGEPP